MSFPPEKEKKKKKGNAGFNIKNEIFLSCILLSEFAFHCRDLISFMGSP